MAIITVFRSLDGSKLVVLALVTRGGVSTVEQHEIPEDADAFNALIETLHDDQPEIPLGLEKCRRCSCCGRPIVGYDSSDLFQLN